MTKMILVAAPANDTNEQTRTRWFCVCVCVQVPEVLFLVPGETAQIHQQERLHHGECLPATALMSLLSPGAGTSC